MPSQYTVDPDELARIADYGGIWNPPELSDRADIKPQTQGPGTSLEALDILLQAGGLPSGGTPPGMLAITKNQTLKQLGKLASKFLGEVKRTEVGRRININRVRSIGKEVRESPEKLFDAISRIDVSEPQYKGISYYQPKDKSIRFSASDFSPKSLRHEISHSRQVAMPERDMYPSINKVPLPPQEEISFWRGIPRETRNKMQRSTYPEPYQGYHSLAPEEISAIQMENIPLSGWRNVEDYDKYLNKNLSEGLGVGQERSNRLYRLLKEIASNYE